MGGWTDHYAAVHTTQKLNARSAWVATAKPNETGRKRLTDIGKHIREDNL